MESRLMPSPLPDSVRYIHKYLSLTLWSPLLRFMLCLLPKEHIYRIQWRLNQVTYFMDSVNFCGTPYIMMFYVFENNYYLYVCLLVILRINTAPGIKKQHIQGRKKFTLCNMVKFIVDAEAIFSQSSLYSTRFRHAHGSC